MFPPEPVLRSPHLLRSLRLPTAAGRRAQWDMNRHKWDIGGGDATAVERASSPAALRLLHITNR